VYADGVLALATTCYRSTREPTTCSGTLTVRPLARTGDRDDASGLWPGRGRESGIAPLSRR
jgi:hypothetical protein